MKQHGHYCRVCGEYKANKKFSGMLRGERDLESSAGKNNEDLEQPRSSSFEFN